MHALWHRVSRPIPKLSPSIATATNTTLLSAARPLLCPRCSCGLSHFDLELLRGLVAQHILELVDLFVGQRPFHRPVGCAVALGALSRLGVGELVDALNL